MSFTSFVLGLLLSLEVCVLYCIWHSFKFYFALLLWNLLGLISTEDQISSSGCCLTFSCMISVIKFLIENMHPINLCHWNL